MRVLSQEYNPKLNETEREKVRLYFDDIKDIKRPREEMKEIEKFIDEFLTGKFYYKKKKYFTALPNFENAKDILEGRIFDELPRITVLYYVMKTKYHLRLYTECNLTLNRLKISFSDSFQSNHTSLYMHYIEKVFFYELIISNILNDLNQSIQKTIDLINFIKQDKFPLQQKFNFFRTLLYDLMKAGDLYKSKQFSIFKDEFNNMIVESVKGDDDPITQMVKKSMKDSYITFMSTKVRKAIMDKINAEFYLYKYNQTAKNNKVICFLESRINICVRDKNTQKLKEMFETYISLNKVNLAINFRNMNMNDLINELRSRYEAFDIIFGSFCGAFKEIFGKYLTENYIEQGTIKKISDNERRNMLNLKRRMTQAVKDKLQLDEKDILMQVRRESMITLENLQNYVTKLGRYCCKDFNFEKDLKIPPNVEEEKDDTIKININKSASIKRQKKRKKLKIKLPEKTQKSKGNNPNDIISKTTPNESPILNKNYSKPNISKISDKEKQNKPTTPNGKSPERRNIFKPVTFPLRNINNYLINVLIKQFTIQPIFRKSDLLEIKIPNFVKSFGFSSEKGTSPDNQDLPFNYENFLLIKGFSVFGLCDGHGKFGRDVAVGFKKLFPSYMYYLTMDNNLTKREEDINENIISLFKLEERTDVKELNIISYFFKKFDMIYDFIPFIKHNFTQIKQTIVESFGRSHFDIKTRLKIDIENSGTTVCTLMIYGATLYCVNCGDSRAIMGKYDYKNNSWISNQISNDHKPEKGNELKRINLNNGKVQKAKDDKGELSGPFRVWFKEGEQVGPGLAMSRSIGDEVAKGIGVTFEPEVIEYTFQNEDKFLVIGTDGLYDILTNEEIVNVVGEIYEMKGKAEDAAKRVVEKARKRAEIKVEALRELKGKGSKAKGFIIDDITCWVIFIDVVDEKIKDPLRDWGIEEFLKSSSYVKENIL